VITEDEYRAIMRNLAAGVTVVTTELDGRYFGMTATSFTSVSLDPMLVQVALERTSRTHAAVKEARKFGINILAANQEEIARKCSETLASDRFDDIEVKAGEIGVPLIVGSIGTLECELVDEVEGGDHTVFVGEVLHGFASDGPPLVYFQGTYRGLEDSH
jgi:flavin reductase (DIM6/NTAB) family NADH-FMN oxidoreductase RutF